MRLIHRQRRQRPRAPRISISQEEIAADLHYPASQAESSRASSTRSRTPKPLASLPV
jgi:hypothetical protein